MSCSRLKRTFLRSFNFTQLAHLQTFESLCPGGRCSTCITFSSIASICSSARRIRTPDHPPTPSQSHQLIVPLFSGTRQQLTQHCRILVLQGVNFINFDQSQCPLNTPTLSCATALNVSFRVSCLLFTALLIRNHSRSKEGPYFSTRASVPSSFLT